MLTKKLYKQDVYLKNCTSKILEIQENSLVLDATIFFPEGGGQPCDIGSIDGVDIINVQEKDQKIYHYLATQSNPFNVNQEVHLSIDWNFRFYNMQRHCGEHILSGIFFNQLGAVNRGFHMGNEYMTVDMDLPQISWEQAMNVELAANEVVWSNAPTIVRTFENREEAENLPLRKPLDLDDDITIVCVGDTENPADCVACCGTHPSTSGQVGLIKIIKLESYKGMMRVYFKAGREAYKDFTEKHDVVSALFKKYSAGTADLLDKVKTIDEKNGQVRKKLFDIKKVLLSKELDAINAQIALNGNEKKSIHRFDYQYLDLDDIQGLGRNAINQVNGLLLLVSTSDNTVLMFSHGTPDCGKLVRDNAEIYNGKGGGNTAHARAIFSKGEYVDTFIDLLEKHLR